MNKLLISATLAFAVDQVSKWAIVHGLNLRERLAIDVLPPLLNFRMGWNEGINFGLFSDSPAIMRWVLSALAIVVSIWLVWWSKRTLTRSITLIGAGLVVGGALGNAIDRVIYGAVADFLNMSCCGFTNPYTFNVADVAIFAGAFIRIAYVDPNPA
jgi:signal peptidase II